MSLTQSRPETNDPLFRNQGGGRSSYAFRGRGRGRGRSNVGPNSHIDPLSSQNLCYKKVNNAHGGHSRANHESVNSSDSNPPSGTHSVKNDHIQPALQGVSKTPAPATVAKPADALPHKTGQPLPKAPSSSTNSDSVLPSPTPAKEDGAKGFILQFGSISPGFMNDWQAPRDASKVVPVVPLLYSLKQDLSKKNVALIEKPDSQETKTEPQAKKDVLVASTSPPTQAPKHCGANPQIRSQGVSTSSPHMPPQIPLEMGNSSQIPQQGFVPGLVHPPLQTTYQGQDMGYDYQAPVQSHSLPLTSTELNATTGSSFHHLGVNLPSSNLPVKSGVSNHGNSDPSSTDHTVIAQNMVPRAQPSLIPITTETAGEKATITNQERLEVLPPDNALKGSDSIKGADQGNKVKLSKKAEVTPKPISANTLEVRTEHESKILDMLRPGSSSGSLAGSSKVPTEPDKTKNRGKKLKELLQKADALETTIDLFMAYKGPEHKEESPVASEHAVEGNMNEVSANASGIEKNTLKNKDEEGKVEIDDWEEAADISTPNLNFFGEAVRSEVGVTVKKYSRDFLLIFADLCTDIHEGFEITSDIAGALLCGSVSTPRSGCEYHSPRRAVDRPGGASLLDRRGSGTMDADKWRKQPGPFPPSQDSKRDIAYRSNGLGSQGERDPTYSNLRNPSAQHAGGVLPGLRNHSDTWQRGTNFHKVLMPSTHAQTPVIHKAEIKYVVGKVTDEEQAKQRKLKGILNKLTPQNFERLFEQIKEVNIDNVTTLTGVISQIFDKALTEPTFCEMYANFCQHLASELPDLTVDNEKITFRRLLLNKCQEEFERGEREEQEACNVDVEGDTEQSEELREQKRVKARRLMLGNIRLIGELYKKRMLTERIMHECIKKLLGQYQNPDEENIEALCKLMSTIGEMIDHPKAKEHMDAYFDIMGQLSNNMALSSRVRFMLKDAIDVRKNKWQQRMKVEGPKKIEDVHRDAAQERQGLVSRLNHDPSFNSMRRGQPLDFGPRGSMLSPSVGQGMSFRGIPPQVRGFGGQDMRTDVRSILMPLPHRLSADKQFTLGPQVGHARGQGRI